MYGYRGYVTKKKKVNFANSHHVMKFTVLSICKLGGVLKLLDEKKTLNRFVLFWGGKFVENWECWKLRTRMN